MRLIDEKGFILLTKGKFMYLYEALFYGIQKFKKLQLLLQNQQLI
jgi:hypothetical protein